MTDGALKRVVVYLLVTGLLLICVMDAAAKDRRGGYIVMIDPAHGGDEKGVKLNEEVFEKQITLALAEQIKTFIEKTGKGTIGLTRAEDRTVLPEKRMKAASDIRAELFISIHVNAGFGGQASGFEIHFQGFKVPGGDKSDSGEIVKDMIHTQSLNESVRFSQIVERHLERVFPRKGRGLRDSPLRILQGLAIPAVVVETAFATEAKDRKALLNPVQQKAIAEAIGKSIMEYF